MAATIAAMALFGQSAEAGKRHQRHHYKHQERYQPRGPLSWLFRGDPNLTAVQIGVGAASTGAYFALKPHNRARVRVGGVKTNGAAWGLSTVGCMVLSPMIGAAVVGKVEQRELSQREALVMVSNCVVPVLGGLYWNWWFDHHPEADVPPVRFVRERHHRRWR